mgnify:CR=1 FL=1
MKKFSEMKFKKPDLKKIERDCDAIVTEFTSAETFDEQNKALKKMFKYSDHIRTNFSIAHVKYTCDTQDPQNVKNQELVDEISPIIGIFSNKFNKALVNAKFRPELEAKWGTHLFNMVQNELDTFDEKIVPLGLMDKALELKAKGKIRHISFSFHDTPEALKHIIDNGYAMESVLLQYNLLDRANEEMIQYAASKGLGVVVMGPVGGGRLAAPTELAQKLGSGNLHTYELALRFVLGNPDVSCALSGMQNSTMVEQNAAVASLEEPMTEEQWKAVGESLEQLHKFSELYCTGCGYCQPCPKGIQIPKIFQFYTYHNVYGLHELAGKSFRNYVNNEKTLGVTSKDCVNCGYCEKKCPQHLQVRELLKKVEATLTEL